MAASAPTIPPATTDDDFCAPLLGAEVADDDGAEPDAAEAAAEDDIIMLLPEVEAGIEAELDMEPLAEAGAVEAPDAAREEAGGRKKVRVIAGRKRRYEREGSVGKHSRVAFVLIGVPFWSFGAERVSLRASRGGRKRGGAERTDLLADLGAVGLGSLEISLRARRLLAVEVGAASVLPWPSARLRERDPRGRPEKRTAGTAATCRLFVRVIRRGKRYENSSVLGGKERKHGQRHADASGDPPVTKGSTRMVADGRLRVSYALQVMLLTPYCAHWRRGAGCGSREGAWETKWGRCKGQYGTAPGGCVCVCSDSRASWGLRS